LSLFSLILASKFLISLLVLVI